MELLRNVKVETRVPRTPGTLKEVESAHTSLELYAWLSLRFPANFPDSALASSLIGKSNLLIQSGLLLMTREGVDLDRSAASKVFHPQGLRSSSPHANRDAVCMCANARVMVP